MVTFDEAYEAAAARYGEEAWWNLDPTAVILAILEAMRRLEQKRQHSGLGDGRLKSRRPDSPDKWDDSSLIGLASSFLNGKYASV
jgi:hypothetical protein